MLKYVTALVVLLAAPSVFAQGASQDPPSPGSSQSSPESSNSLPRGAANMNINSSANPNAAGSDLGAQTTTPPARQ